MIELLPDADIETRFFVDEMEFYSDKELRGTYHWVLSMGLMGDMERVKTFPAQMNMPYLRALEGEMDRRGLVRFGRDRLLTYMRTTKVNQQLSGSKWIRSLDDDDLRSEFERLNGWLISGHALLGEGVKMWAYRRIVRELDRRGLLK